MGFILQNCILLIRSLQTTLSTDTLTKTFHGDVRATVFQTRPFLKFFFLQFLNHRLFKTFAAR